MHNDERKPGDETKSNKRRQPLTLSKETLRALSARTGVRTGMLPPSQGGPCNGSTGPRCLFG